MKEVIGWLCAALALLSLISGAIPLTVLFGGVGWWLIASGRNDAADEQASLGGASRGRLEQGHRPPPLNLEREHAPPPLPASHQTDVLEEIDRLLRS